jgi:Amt family ammonium transporter
VTGVVCFFAIQLKFRLEYDDSLDVVGVHLVGGVLGSLLLGLFADTTVNPLGADGLFNGGGASLLGKQLLAVVATLAYSGVVTGVLAFFVHRVIGLRVTEDQEAQGLDITQHAEVGYNL